MHSLQGLELWVPELRGPLGVNQDAAGLGLGVQLVDHRWKQRPWGVEPEPFLPPRNLQTIVGNRAWLPEAAAVSLHDVRTMTGKRVERERRIQAALHLGLEGLLELRLQAPCVPVR